MDHQAIAQLLGNYGEFLGAIAVVVTLGYLAVQIRQNSDLAKAQLFNDHTNSRREWNQAMMGENAMQVVAKSIENPQDLTLAELHIMDMYLIGALNEVRRLDVLKGAGLEVDASIEGLQYLHFGSNFAKAWYAQYSSGWSETGAVHDKITAVNADWVISFFGGVMGRIGASSGQQIEVSH